MNIQAKTASVLLLLAPVVYGQKSQYVIVSHAVTKDGRHAYTARHGAVVIKVQYDSSQTSSWPNGKEWDGGIKLAEYLHLHLWNNKPDLSQVPSIGVPINECIFSKNRDKDGDPVIAVQPTDAPCISHTGDMLHYLPMPNGHGPDAFQYVNFEILSEQQGTK